MMRICLGQMLLMQSLFGKNSRYEAPRHNHYTYPDCLWSILHEWILLVSKVINNRFKN